MIIFPSAFLRTQSHFCLFLTFSMMLLLALALGFEYWGGYVPCRWCYIQRIPYYTGIFVAASAYITRYGFGWSYLVSWLPIFVAAIMLCSFFLATYHLSIEAGWFLNPPHCEAPSEIVLERGSLIESLEQPFFSSCEKPSLLILGFSLAFWNALVSFVLMLIALCPSILKSFEP